jgi:choloylglycine hydrolase
MHLSPKAPENNFSKDVDLKHYSKGMGAIGLPGDLSSMSRFVRVAFVKSNSASGNGEGESISQFFHILNSVDQPRGCNLADRDEYEITVYTSCMNADKGVYYYTTYDNHQISCVNMFHENLDSCKLKCYPLIMGEQINCQN